MLTDWETYLIGSLLSGFNRYWPPSPSEQVEPAIDREPEHIRSSHGFIRGKCDDLCTAGISKYLLAERGGHIDVGSGD